MQKLYTLITRSVLNSLKPMKLQRLHSKYQFRVEKPFSYPDRRMEIRRATSAELKESCRVAAAAKMPQQQLVSATNSKSLPRDFYYRVLGLTKRATSQQIKSAYYALAKAFHPDTNRTPQETQRFKDISAAYRILTDDNRRIEYDQYGLVRDEATEGTTYLPPSNQEDMNADERSNDENRLKAVDGSSSSSSSTGGSSNDYQSSSHMNKMDVGGNNKSERKSVYQLTTPSTVNAADKYKQSESAGLTCDIRRINSIDPTIVLTFKEAALGIKRNHDLRYLKVCPDCNGKSAKLNNLTNEICRKCFGTGTMTKNFAMHEITLPCERCQGQKFINNNACNTCNSRGTLRDNTKIVIDIPPGVQTGDYVYADNPATKKKVKFNIQVKESHNFQRKGNDAITTKYIKVSEAILGCKTQVQGLYGIIDLQIKPGTESHTQFRMSGKGIKTRDGRIGDHIIIIKVCIPKKISTKQRQIILALSKCEEQTVVQPTEDKWEELQ